MPSPLRAIRWPLLCLLLLLTLPVVAEEAVPVSVEFPQRENLAETLRLSGSVVAVQRASLSARVDGLVGEILVDAGATVEKGEPLMQQDSALAELEQQQAFAAQAEAAVAKDEAQRLLDEARRLQKNNHVSENEVRTRWANLALANAAWQAAQARANFSQETVQRHRLLAPFAGVISQRMVDAGEWLNRGDPAFELVSLDQVLVDVNVPQERYRELGPQTAVRLCPDTAPGQCLAGNIAAIIPVSDASARAFRLRLAPTDKSAALLPGTSAAVELELGAENVQLLVSRDALLRHPDGGNSVFVIRDGKAKRRSVTLAREVGGKVAVIDGIGEQDQVVVRGNELLSDGQAVRVREAASSKSAPSSDEDGQ